MADPNFDCATPPNVRVHQDEEKDTTVTWRRSPNTGKKRAAARQIHNPENQIDALEGVLADVHAKRNTEGNDLTDSEIDTDGDGCTRQLFQSWLHEEHRLGDSPIGEMSTTNNMNTTLSVSRGNSTSNPTNKKRRRGDYNDHERVKKLSANAGSDDGNLLKILDRLENNIPTDIGQAPNESGKNKNEATTGSKKDPFYDRMMAAKKLRDRKRMEARNRANAQRSLKNAPRAEQIPIQQAKNAVNQTSYVKYNKVTTSKPTRPGVSYKRHTSVLSQRNSSTINKQSHYQRAPPEKPSSAPKEKLQKTVLPERYRQAPPSVNTNYSHKAAVSGSTIRLNSNNKVNVQNPASKRNVLNRDGVANNTSKNNRSANSNQGAPTTFMNNNHLQSNRVTGNQQVKSQNIKSQQVQYNSHMNTGTNKQIQRSLSVPCANADSQMSQNRLGQKPKRNGFNETSKQTIGLQKSKTFVETRKPIMSTTIARNPSEANKGSSDLISNAQHRKENLNVGRTNISANVNSSTTTEFDDDDDFLAAICSVASQYDSTSAKGSICKKIPTNTTNMPAHASSLSSKTKGLLAPASASYCPGPSTFTRFKVTSITRGILGHMHVLKLDVVIVPGDIPAKVELRDCWAATPVQMADILNIIWTNPLTPKLVEILTGQTSASVRNDKNAENNGDIFVVDDRQNFLVLCPDLLVSPTRITGAIQCVRRSVLADQIQSYSPSKFTAMGNAKHELVERALIPSGSGEINSQHSQARFDTKYLENVISDVVRSPKIVEELFATGLTEDMAINQLRAVIRPLQNWASQTMECCGANKGPVLQFGNGNSRHVKITEIIATEEKVWSPMWGLKGQMDIMVNARVKQDDSSTMGKFINKWQQSNQNQKNAARNSDEEVLVPLELKTGYKLKDEHHAQVALYSLLVTDRYRGLSTAGSQNGPLSFASGLLMHIGSQQQRNDSNITASAISHGVKHFRDELKSLLMLRNQFAASSAPKWVRSKSEKANNKEADVADMCLPQLPPVVGNNYGECNRCYQKDVCMLYHRSLEGGTAHSSGLREEDFEKTVGFLNQKQLEYFKNWDHLLNLEFSSYTSYQREIWTLSGTEREALGRCLCEMKLVQSDCQLSNDMSAAKSYTHTFERHENSKYQSIQTKGNQFDVGTYVALSIEGSHHVIMSGRVNSISVDQICIKSQHALRIPKTSDLKMLRWRIDIDEMFTNLKSVKNNLVQLFVETRNNGDEISSQGAIRLRDLIVDFVEPRFSNHAAEALGDILCSNGHLMKEFKKLNQDQIAAVSSVLNTEDYLCIQGMPGTGKTTTINFIIQALRERGHSVLVVAYTHTAVDNLLLKLKNDGVPFHRIGRVSQVHPEIANFTLENPTLNKLKELEIDRNLVVGTTCLSIRHPLFQRRKFDYCIVDEAGQITQPVVLGPLRCAKRFVLVGDQFQLPPLVKSEHARRLGMDESLFKRLGTAHEDKMVKLTIQFRMNKEIMLLCNTLVYNNKLKCGNEAVANRRLQLPHFPQAIPQLTEPNQTPWLKIATCPDKPVVFFDTDKVVDAKESGSENKTEARLCKAVIDSFVGCGLSVSDIGVITPYRSQAGALKHKLRNYLPDLEVHTIDKYQGRDKSCIIMSLVRSNIDRKVGNLLCDWRRINVAFTRAKCKLVLFGSRKTLEQSEVFAKFLKLAEKMNYITELQQCPLLAYGINDFNSQSQSQRIQSTGLQEVRVPSGGSNPVLRDIAIELNSERNRVIGKTSTHKMVTSAAKNIDPLNW